MFMQHFFMSALETPWKCVITKVTWELWKSLLIYMPYKQLTHLYSFDNITVTDMRNVFVHILTTSKLMCLKYNAINKHSTLEMKMEWQFGSMRVSVLHVTLRLLCAYFARNRRGKRTLAFLGKPHPKKKRKSSDNVTKWGGVTPCY